MELEDRAASGSTSLELGPRDESWDASAAQKTLKPEDYPKAHLYRDPSKPADEITAYKLPFAKRTDNGLRAVWKGVTAAAGGHGVDALKGVSDSDKAAIRRKIGAYYKKAAKQYDDDSIQPPWEANAAGGGDDPFIELHNIPEPELRFAVVELAGVEVRDPSGTGDNCWTMCGYAAVFNQSTVLYDGKFVRLSESIDPMAFDRVLREQPLTAPEGVVHFNFGHDMNRAVAATDVQAPQAGSLTLSADGRGLFFHARVARDDPDGVAMASKMRTGVLKQASFAFTVNKADVTTTENDDGPDEMHRRILEIGHLYDVCATPQGAYPQTVSQLRTYAAALGHPHAEWGAGPVIPDLGGGSTVIPASAGGGAAVRAREAEARRRRNARRFQKRSTS